ncbi:fumarylacetoacetate hydrolase family protein [Kiloniella sp. b19]|uniref:fumarylacetoacetate hydrolase family protein n=1 Tax=Kiloniella sp. GXU_MW_B19 TaxID=3141326 RepID=UPI0031CF1C37
MTYLFKPEDPKALPIAGEDTLFPVHRIFCVGRNYAKHAEEMGSDPDREPPFFFMKPDSALMINPQTVPFPSATQKLHHEVELVVALHKGGENLKKKEALSCVYGYGTGVDLTRRDLQEVAKDKRHPWASAKAFDCSAPVSTLTPLPGQEWDGNSTIRLSVNDERRQKAEISHMTWSIREVISHLSRLFALMPGDLIFTGTPAGVGPLDIGDRVQAEIDGLHPLDFKIG